MKGLKFERSKRSKFENSTLTTLPTKRMANLCALFRSKLLRRLEPELVMLGHRRWFKEKVAPAQYLFKWIDLDTSHMPPPLPSNVHFICDWNAYKVMVKYHIQDDEWVEKSLWDGRMHTVVVGGPHDCQLRPGWRRYIPDLDQRSLAYELMTDNGFETSHDWQAAIAWQTAMVPAKEDPRAQPRVFVTANRRFWKFVVTEYCRHVKDADVPNPVEDPAPNPLFCRLLVPTEWGEEEVKKEDPWAVD